ncbi:hypothetical protein R1TS_20620 [Enterobacter cloacae]|uniref:hypothetical protein n=1 Tax=Enterobacter roggenkampii TaxID=1812935 RepID=UPI003089E45A|nr:hypothetical protein R1TS_20620 [Enterobacter cloacae]HCR1886966.1 hypothetical protein [Enterobacter roggenkampii]
MSSITKEWLQKAISQNESMRDEIPFGWDEDDINMLEALRIALASLEAEKSILYRERNPYNGLTTGWQELTEDEYEFIKDNAGENAEFRTVYAAPPAPVSAPDALADDINSDDHPLLWSYNNGWNACRAAMLKGDKS